MKDAFIKIKISKSHIVKHIPLYPCYNHIDLPTLKHYVVGLFFMTHKLNCNFPIGYYYNLLKTHFDIGRETGRNLLVDLSIGNHEEILERKLIKYNGVMACCYNYAMNIRNDA